MKTRMFGPMIKRKHILGNRMMVNPSLSKSPMYCVGEVTEMHQRSEQKKKGKKDGQLRVSTAHSPPPDSGASLSRKTL
jgi:hypothetical protein